MYCNVSDIKNSLDHKTLIQLTDDTGDGRPADNIADAAIESAAAEIDGYLAVRYSLPLTVVPSIIKVFTIDIAIYNLYSRRAGGPPDHWIERYERAIRFFGRIADGDITFGMLPLKNHHAQFDSSDRVFTRKTMEGW